MSGLIEVVCMYKSWNMKEMNMDEARRNTYLATDSND